MLGRLFDIDENVIRLIIAQGNRAVHNPDCHRIMEGSSAADSDLGSRDKPHFSQTSAQFPGDTDCRDRTVLVFTHLP